MERAAVYENLKATELRLGLPGRDDESEVKNNKRSSSQMDHGSGHDAPPPKAQVVGWPPVRCYRKNVVQKAESGFVKVSMDGAPYLRKIEVKLYNNYFDLLKALESMFKCSIGNYNGSEYAPTYEDKDGDWMLVGDVPWDMFITSCKRLRVMKGSEAKGLGCL
ncbi:hypothetical protein ACS0TY_007446 [Phlomoides rotata]